MAQYCYPCLRRVLKIQVSPKQVRLSRIQHLCEGCGQYKRVVVALKSAP